MVDAAVSCNFCGLQYTLPDEEVVGKLPYVLQCGHIFCAECLRSLVSPQASACSNSIIGCPECTIDTEVSEGVDRLPVDSRIIGLIYTAKMNSKRSSRIKDRQKGCQLKSPPTPPLAHQQQAVEEGFGKKKILDDALCKATETLKALDSLHQTFVTGIQAQLMKERTRIINEIEDCFEKAMGILQRRRCDLMSELGCLEQLFLPGREECQKMKKKRKELCIAIQKAQHVRQVPLLETYCYLDEILETLLTDLETELYNKSCLTLRSGLSCILNMDGLTENIRTCLKITDSSDKLVCEGVEVMLSTAEQPSKQPVKGGASGEKRSGKSSPHVNAFPLPSHRKFSSTLSPNVVIEEIIEETDSSAQRDMCAVAHEPLPAEHQKIQRRNRKPLLSKPPVSHPKVLQEWVLVTHVINPAHFYVRYMTEHKAGLLLSKNINCICSEERSYFTAKDQIKTDTLVFARWKDVWCRALICKLYQKGCLVCVTQCSASDVARLQVFFQDYGSCEAFTISDEGLTGLNECVRRADITAHSELQRWAPQAIKCSLNDIIPFDLVKGWSKEASEEMKHVIGSNIMEMQVVGEERDILLVDLKKSSMDSPVNDTPLSLREHLVFMEFARFYSPQVTCVGNKPLQFYPPVHPKLNTELHAVVSHINTPSDFYIQLVDNMEFLLLNTNLQNCYGLPGSESELQIYTPVLSQACVALFDNKDWCRAQIIDFPGGRVVEVQYVDFGNRERLSVKDLRLIKDEFLALPAMAVRCSLADVLSVRETWSDEAIQLFRELTEQMLVTVVAKKLVPYFNPMPVCLFKISEHSSECLLSIGEIMLTKGLASSSKQSPLKEEPKVAATIWDPLLEEVMLSPNEPVPPVDSSEEQLSLILPPCVKDVRVRITHVTSPVNICVQLLQFDPQLKRVHDLLKEYSKSELQEVDWKAEMSCAANVNGVWERGKLCSVSSSKVAEVLRCDFGNTIKLHFSNLRPLPPKLGGSFLLECCLRDIRPAGGCSTWTATACDFLSYYLSGATAIMTIKDPSSVGPVPVSLFCSSRAGQDVSIADFLVSEGLALRERSSRNLPTFKPDSASTSKLVRTSRESVSQEESKHENSQLNESPAHSQSCSPKPAPCINPPSERVKTKAYLPPELPTCGLIYMNISAVSEDGIIYAMTQEAEGEFKCLQECLQQRIKTLPRQKRYNWKSVLGCAVMGSDMLWYRGHVQEVIGGHVKVQYVDLGIVEDIPVCHVYPVMHCENVPQLCVPCQISGVLPVGETWQCDAVALMKELLLGRMANVQIMELPGDPRGLVTVEIMLDGMPLSRIMVDNQHAVFDPPIGSSKDCGVKPLVPDLDDWDLTTEGLETPDPVIGVYTDLKLPVERKQFWVRISHIRTPSEVFLSLVDQNMCEAESLEKALEEINVDSFPLLTDFPIEGPCMAEYSDGKYYRAKLLGFSELNPSIQLLVRHVDFGSDDIVPPCKLRCLPVSLLHFPCLAVFAQLAGFRPPRLCLEEERIPYRPEWSMRAMQEMIELLHGKLRAVVMSLEPELTVMLYKADGTLVHSPLVAKGLADYD